MVSYPAPPPPLAVTVAISPLTEQVTLVEQLITIAAPSRVPPCWIAMAFPVNTADWENAFIQMKLSIRTEARIEVPLRGIKNLQL
jgi:hypothetical protein